MDRNKLALRIAYFILGAVVVAAIYLLFIAPASAQQFQGQTQNTLSTSASNADANSSSTSGSVANSASNQAQTATLGAQQGNAQSITFNTEQRKTTQLDTNTAVPLAAAVSFSSDYCGGVASGGASAAGVSIGASKPVMDGNCQSMRRAEKFGVMAVTAHNMGEHAQSSRLLAMAIWELCTAEDNSGARESSQRGRSGVPSTQAGCLHLGLVKPEQMGAEPAMPAEKVEPLKVSKASAESVQGAIDVLTRVPPTAPPYNPTGPALARLPGN